MASNTLLEHGEQLARDSLKKNPAKLITLMNACCNLSNSNIAIDRHKGSKASQSFPNP